METNIIIKDDWVLYINTKPIEQDLIGPRVDHPIITVAELKDALAICPFKDLILNGQDYYLAWIGGSYCDGTFDNFSDVDLCILVKEAIPDKDYYYLTYKGVHVHWFNMPLETYALKYKKTSGIYNVGKFKHKYFKRELHVCWENPKYLNFIDKFSQQKVIDKIANIGLIIVAIKMKLAVDYFLDNHTINLNYNCKFFGVLLQIKYLLNGENYLDHLDLIRKVKRLRYIPLSDEDLETLYQEMTIYKKLITPFLALPTSTFEYQASKGQELLGYLLCENAQ